MYTKTIINQLFFFSFNTLEALLPALISKWVQPANRGAALGIYSSCQFAGAFAGGLLGGLLLQYMGLPAIFIFGSIISGFWLIMAGSFAVDAGLLSGRFAVDTADEQG